MWLTKQITRYFQDRCDHPNEAVRSNIRVDKSLEKRDEWSIEWCGLCGAFRGCRTLIGVGSTSKFYNDWIRPRADYN